MNKRRLIASILEIIIGLVLVAASVFGTADEFWNGMGTALLIIGIIFLVKTIKYNTNNDYKEKYDIEINDERNKYLSLKAWAWAGYLFVMISAVITIVMKLIGKEELMMITSGSVCLVMVLYWTSYMVLKKKY